MAKTKNAALIGSASNDVLTGLEGTDLIVGFAGQDRLDGGDGNDILDGGSGADTLMGGTGFNVLRGGLGDDLILSSGERDTLEGGQGDDLLFLQQSGATLVFNAGFGRDRVLPTPGVTYSLKFGAGYKAADAQLMWLHPSPDAGGVLALGFKNSADFVVLGFPSTQRPTALPELLKVEFGDGKAWTPADVLSRLQTLVQPSQVIDGTSGADLLGAGAGMSQGDHVVRGFGGNDTLVSGAGNDVLLGGADDDTYRFNAGWGQDQINNAGDTAVEGPGHDVIRFGPGIAASSLTFGIRGDDLLIQQRKGTDTLLVRAYFSEHGKTAGHVERIRFEDGTELRLADVLRLNRQLASTPGNDVWQGWDDNDRHEGGAGDDTLIGADGLDTLLGGQGSDVLNGGAGNDRLDGGAGDDLLSDYGHFIVDVNGSYYESGGSDTYRFDSGFGQDLVDDRGLAGGTDADTIEFGVGIRPGDVLLYKRANDLVVQLRNAPDAVTVLNHFAPPDERGLGQAIELIRFNDGTRWDLAAIQSRAVELPMDLFGSEIAGTGQNDTLKGALGADTLAGGAGSDTYVIGRDPYADVLDSTGNGAKDRDTLVFTDGITASSIRLMGSGNDLTLKTGVLGSVTIRDFLATPDGATIATVRFADGTTWGAGELRRRATTGTSENDSLWGSVLDDTLTGGAGDDFLSDPQGGRNRFDGGAGNDILNGGPGQDSFVFGVGSGHDQLNAFDPTQGDVVLLGTKDISVRPDPDTVPETIVVVLNQTQETLRIVANGVLAPSSVLLKFADGSQWTYADVLRLYPPLQPPKPIVGTDANDTLAGGSGDDLITGGRGDDVIAGSRGINTYAFSQGDGRDTILSSPGSDSRNIVKFGAGIAPADVVLTRFDATSNRAAIAFSNAGDAIDVADNLSAILFSNGATWNAADIAARAAQGSAFNDDISFAGTGAPRLLNGQEGRDRLMGGSANDTLNGGTSDDELHGSEGRDLLRGDAGNDLLEGGSGRDTFDGGAGDDRIESGDGERDTILFGRGDGRDEVQGGAGDLLQFKAGVTADEVLAFNDGGLLTFAIKGSDERLIADALTPEGTLDFTACFSNGTTWNAAVLGAASANLYVEATPDADAVSGSAGHDYLAGGEGNDTLTGLAGNDELRGEAGDDRLDGGAGNDWLAGGVGKDTLTGGAGNDTYVFNRGDAADVIIEADGRAGNSDLLAFRDIDSSELWFARSGQNLTISVLGTSDQVTVQDWYSGAAAHVERITASGDGKGLNHAKVDALVAAMSAFSAASVSAASTQGSVSGGAAAQDTLNAVLAANWT